MRPVGEHGLAQTWLEWVISQCSLAEGVGQEHRLVRQKVEAIDRQVVQLDERVGNLAHVVINVLREQHRFPRQPSGYERGRTE